MRAFIALNLPESEKRRLHAAVAPLRDAALPFRWVEPDAIHLTLKFLGEVRGPLVDRVRAVVRRIAAKSRPFTVPISGFGAFPTLRRPRVLWVGVEATPELRSLKHDLEWDLAPLGFDREVRAFHPHLTLGRASGTGRLGDYRAIESAVAAVRYEGVLPVDGVDLMRSHLSPKGARYERLDHAAIGVPAEAAGGAREA